MILVPQMCKGVSKLRHLKIFWERTGAAPGFVLEVIGRCNGACVQGVQYKEGDKIRLPGDQISAIAVGQSCYIFFAPAMQENPQRLLALHPSLDDGGENSSEPESIDAAPAGVPTTSVAPGSAPPTSGVRRFPKVWSKCIMDVFTSFGATAMSQSDLLDKFRTMHADACNVYFGPTDSREELWSNLKKFISKPPFTFDSNALLVRFDPGAVKPRTTGGVPKRQKTTTDPSEIPDMVVDEPHVTAPLVVEVE